MCVFKNRSSFYVMLCKAYLKYLLMILLGAQFGSAKFNSGNQWWWNIDEGGEKNFFIIISVAMHIGFVYYYLARRYLIFLKLVKKQTELVVIIRYILFFKIYEIEIKSSVRDVQSVVRIDCREGKLEVVNLGYSIYILDKKSCEKIENYLSMNLQVTAHKGDRLNCRGNMLGLD